jgi:IS5 family transposase
VHFRKRIGVKGFNLIFKMSVALHGKQAQESSVLIDTTVQEKNMDTYENDKLSSFTFRHKLKLRNSAFIAVLQSYCRYLTTKEYRSTVD